MAFFSDPVGLVSTFAVAMIKAIDYQNDGDLDIIIGGYDQTQNWGGLGNDGGRNLVVCENDGNGNFNVQIRVMNRPSHGYQNADFIDINGDGTQDIIYAIRGALSVTARLGYLLNLNGSYGNENILHTNPTSLGDNLNYDIADIDNDGDPDIVRIDPSGTYIYRNNGVGNFTLTDSLAMTGTAILIKDFDLDGLEDFIIGNSLGYPTYTGYYKRILDLNFEPYFSFGLGVTDIIDYDNDNDLDLLGTNTLKINIDNSNFNTVTLPLNVEKTRDFDLNGQFDFVGFGKWSSVVCSSNLYGVDTISIVESPTPLISTCIDSDSIHYRWSGGTKPYEIKIEQNGTTEIYYQYDSTLSIEIPKMSPCDTSKYLIQLSSNSSIFHFDTVNVSCFDTSIIIAQHDTVYLNPDGISFLDTIGTIYSAGKCGIVDTVFSKTAFECIDLGIDTIDIFFETSEGDYYSRQLVVTILDTISPHIDNYISFSLTQDSINQCYGNDSIILNWNGDFVEYKVETRINNDEWTTIGITSDSSASVILNPAQFENPYTLYCRIRGENGCASKLDSIVVYCYDECSFYDIDLLTNYKLIEPLYENGKYTLIDNLDGSFTKIIQPDSEHGNDESVYADFCSGWVGAIDDLEYLLFRDHSCSRYKSFIKFPISNDLTSSQIISAKLSLYHPGSNLLSQTHSGININRITSQWSSYLGTQTTSTNSVLTPALPTSTSHLEGIDITEMIKDIIDNSNYGIQLNTIGSNTYFASSRHTESELRPKLEITYSVDSVSHMSCSDPNFLLEITPSGSPVGNFSYSWSHLSEPISNHSTLISLPQDSSFIVTATDENGCSQSTQIDISFNKEIILNNIIDTIDACYGQNSSLLITWTGISNSYVVEESRGFEWRPIGVTKDTFFNINLAGVLIDSIPIYNYRIRSSLDCVSNTESIVLRCNNPCDYYSLESQIQPFSISDIYYDYTYGLDGTRTLSMYSDPNYVEDALVRSFLSSNTNYGSSLDFNVTLSQHGDQESYVKFNFPFEIDTTNLVEAILHISQRSGSNIQIILRSAVEEWSESSITWNTKPEVTDSEMITTTANSLASLDILDLFKVMIRNGGHGLQLSTTGSGFARFRSSERGGGPRMTLKFKSPFLSSENCPSDSILLSPEITGSLVEDYSYSWIVNVDTLSNERILGHRPLVNTTYELIVSDANGCSDSMNFNHVVNMISPVTYNFLDTFQSCTENDSINISWFSQQSPFVLEIQNASGLFDSVLTTSQTSAWIPISHGNESSLRFRITDTNECQSLIDTIWTQTGDEIPPELLLKQRDTLYFDPFGNVDISISDFILYASDNCEVQDTIIDKSEFSCEDEGVNKSIISILDSNGNISEDTILIYLLDSTQNDDFCRFDQRLYNSNAYHADVMVQDTNYIEKSTDIAKKSHFAQKHLMYSPKQFEVVFHILYTADHGAATALANSQIAALNRDFGPPDLTSRDDSTHHAKAVDMEMSFSLAPNGVIMHNRRGQFFEDYNDYKSSQMGGNDPVDPDQYINVWVVDLDFSKKSFAQCPGGQILTDGIVLDHTLFGQNNGIYTKYQEGKTLTHLMGSFFGLKPLTGWARCADDGILDTPVHNAVITDCTFGSITSTCDKKITMPMNFMSLSDDNCQYMFTEGQKRFVHAILESDPNRQSLIRNQD